MRRARSGADPAFAPPVGAAPLPSGPDDPVASWILAEGDGCALGALRLGLGHPRWRRVERVHGRSPEDAVVIVVPRVPVRLRVAGEGTLTLAPGAVFRFEIGEEYRREAIASDGDRCDYLLLSAALDEALWADRRARWRVLGPRDMLAFRAFAHAALVRPGPPADVSPLLATTLGSAPAWPPSRLVDRARELFAAAGDGPPRVASLASRLGVSRERLSRLFRERTGMRLSEFRELARLSAALDALAAGPRGGLALLAASLGFASHAHLAARFRRGFGETPSAVRRRFG